MKYYITIIFIVAIHKTESNQKNLFLNILSNKKFVIIYTVVLRSINQRKSYKLIQYVLL